MSTITLDQTRIVNVTRVDSRPRQAAPQLRLTRRGKTVVLGLAAAIIAVTAVLFGPSSNATGEAGVAYETTTLRVEPGQTLWQIAASANPNGDIRATVDEIVELNALPNASSLQMGSQIAVPIYGN
jgi:LysM repeat protein